MSSRRQPVSRRDRPAKAPLSREAVVATALRVMREDGLERVTMRRLGAELDTGPASLYVYVRNTAELHGALLDELLGGIELPAVLSERGWREQLIDLMTAYTVLLFRHPSLARSVLTLRPSGPHYLRLIDTIAGLLLTGGVAVRAAAWGVDLLLKDATASAAEHGSRSEAVDAAAEEEDLVAVVAEASPAIYPNIDRVRGELFSGTGEERLRFSFTTIIDSLERQ